MQAARANDFASTAVICLTHAGSVPAPSDNPDEGATCLNHCVLCTVAHATVPGPSVALDARPVAPSAGGRARGRAALGSELVRAARGASGQRVLVRRHGMEARDRDPIRHASHEDDFAFWPDTEICSTTRKSVPRHKFCLGDSSGANPTSCGSSRSFRRTRRRSIRSATSRKRRIRKERITTIDASPDRRREPDRRAPLAQSVVSETVAKKICERPRR